MHYIAYPLHPFKIPGKLWHSSLIAQSIWFTYNQEIWAQSKNCGRRISGKIYRTRKEDCHILQSHCNLKIPPKSCNRGRRNSRRMYRASLVCHYSHLLLGNVTEICTQLYFESLHFETIAWKSNDLQRHISRNPTTSGKATYLQLMGSYNAFAGWTMSKGTVGSQQNLT